MASERSRAALVLSALGAVLLAVSVFLPWYGVSFTPAGVAFVQHVGEQVASQYGNAALQSYVGSLHSDLGGIAGEQVAALSAHQVLKVMNIVLLVLAGLALLDALVPLGRSSSPLPVGAGASVLLLGALATSCVVYRMLVRPAPAGELLSLSLREGAWLALLGSLTMLFAGLWPLISAGAPPAGDAQLQGAWSELSGWTPGG